jgi:hypothetical protein
LFFGEQPDSDQSTRNMYRNICVLLVVWLCLGSSVLTSVNAASGIWLPHIWDPIMKIVKFPLNPNADGNAVNNPSCSVNGKVCVFFSNLRPEGFVPSYHPFLFYTETVIV